MQAYKYDDLYNKIIQEEAEDAMHDKCIDEATYKNIVASFPTGLFTPNYFIRIALGLLTFVAVLFSGVLLALLLNTSSENSSIALCVLLAIFTYVALEVLIKNKKFYNAGVDNLLSFFTLSFIISVVVIANPSGYISYSLVAMIVSLWLCINFTDAFMALISYLSMFSFIFLCYIKLGTIAIVSAPFVMMIVSACTYLFIAKIIQHKKLLFCRFSCKIVMLLTLVTFYTSSNYFVVKELTNQLFYFGLKTTSIPYGWLFWMLTIAIPIAYLTFGMLRKNLLFLRTGLATLAVSVFTFRYYYAILPVESAMLVAGIILTVVSYVVIRNLKVPMFGFSFEKNNKSRKELMNAEALIIAQAFGKKTTASNNAVEFGGGSFGGGGAGSQF